MRLCVVVAPPEHTQKGHPWNISIYFVSCYILKQEAAALAATQVAFVLQSGQRRGLQFAIAPGPTVNPHQEQV